MPSTGNVDLDPSFVHDHTGAIIKDPSVAILELISNAYDAGATEVKILWSEESGGKAEIQDNGIGMSEDQLLRRWRTLSYSRRRVAHGP